jgi:Fe-S cluster biosynthesis and repair protein YggX
MAEIRCSRCGSTAEGLSRAPLPGRPGELVLMQTCEACWEDWKGTQVKLINEFRLNVAEPAQFERLMTEMTSFLNLKDEEEGSPD